MSNNSTLNDIKLNKLNEYKFNISNRNYLTWSIYDNHTFIEITDAEIINKLLPVDQKLLNDDVFIFNESNELQIIHSTSRLTQNIPAILILDGNKTYGRHNRSKLYYKCIPDDVRLPIFLVPYEIKCNFSKLFQNKYVTINFSNWSQKQPHATISQTIGDVNCLDNFYEYQLYCKSLNYSMQHFQKHASKCVTKYGGNFSQLFADISSKYPSIEDRTSWDVLTIDTANTSDFDDGFSYTLLSDGTHRISIYISNVSLLLDYFNLWESFSNRIATIYLPDKKRPMLPSVLSDNLCSLHSGLLRIALTLDILVSAEYEIISTNYLNSLINVSKNYVYDEQSLVESKTYLKTFETVCKLSKKYNYINNVKNSHDVISYLMIFMNYYSATELLKFRNGIFRTNATIANNIKLIKNNLISIPEDVKNYITVWNSSLSQYVNIQENPEFIRHDSLNIDAYIHITSPIRRLVDLLNMIQLQNNLNLIELKLETNIFYNNWLDKLNYINVTMRNIRKVQNDCNLLAICVNNETICNKIHEGYCFDKIIRNGGLFQYVVYLPELKITSKIVTRIDIEEYSKQNYKLYIFQDEDKLKKKIRIQLL
jgi:exoribonuclease R